MDYYLSLMEAQQDRAYRSHFPFISIEWYCIQLVIMGFSVTTKELPI